MQIWFCGIFFPVYMYMYFEFIVYFLQKRFIAQRYTVRRIPFFQ